MTSAAEMEGPASEATASVDSEAQDGPNLDAILSIPVTVQVVLGTTSMPVARLMKLGRGAVITLDQKVGAPVNVLVNGRVVARGEVVVVDEDSSRFGVTLTEIVNSTRENSAA
jgi:flagellar motor switch protein FliN/FliY